MTAAGYVSETQSQIKTLIDLLRYRAIAQPDETAFVFLKDGEAVAESWTYQQLDQQAQGIAVHLQAITRPGDRVLLLYPSGLEFIAAFFGCLYAEVIAVPAYPPKANQNLNRLQAIVSDAEAAVAMTTQALLPDLRPKWQAEALPAIQWLASDGLHRLDQSWREPDISPDTLAFLQYTSGSTGNPKGVMVSHGNLMHNERLIKQAFGHHDNTVSVGWLPLFHDMGLVGNVLQPLYLGQPCTLMSPVSFLQKPLRWLQAISDYRATSSGGPNFAYELCVRKITPEQRQGLDLSSWDVAFTGAEPIRAETLERFAAAFGPCGFRREAFYPCYGMAESTLFVTGPAKTAAPTILTVDADSLSQNRVVPTISGLPLVGCGHTRFDQNVIVVNPERLTECHQGEVGEIWVSGPSVAQGYWNRPDATAATFQAQLTDSPDQFLRTGDLGFIQGIELFVTGRLKDVIIIRGRNHYPQDIEQTVEQCHPSLRSPSGAAAFTVELEGEEKLIVVAEVERTALRKTAASELDQIFSQIRAAVAQHHDLQVQAIALLKPTSLPKTSSGKIQRYACRMGFQSGTLSTVATWTLGQPLSSPEPLPPSGPAAEPAPVQPSPEAQPAATPNRAALLRQSPAQQQQAIQSWLQTQVASRLKLRPSQIDPQQPLIDYGLDSVEAVGIVAELEDWLEQQLSPDLLNDHLTIAKLSQTLVGQIQKPTLAEPLCRLPRRRSRLFWSWGQTVYQNWFQLTCHGLENLPTDRPYLLAANHSSHLDAGAIVVSLLKEVDQVISLGAKDYFFDHAFKSWFSRSFLNLIPLDREGSLLGAMDALRHCEQLLSARTPILIFPEGTRSQTGELQEFQPGLGLLALQLQVPIVPVYLEGTY
ncbi:MAG: AMP-binding protein, partial [Elainella sp.]